MSTPTSNPNELTQDSVKETFTQWTEKGLGLAAGSLLSTVITLTDNQPFVTTGVEQRNAI